MRDDLKHLKYAGTMPYAFTEYDVAMLSREYVKQAPPCLTYELIRGT